jgi:hypothetical protein
MFVYYSVMLVTPVGHLYKYALVQLLLTS